MVESKLMHLFIVQNLPIITIMGLTRMSSLPNDRWISIDEAADYLGVKVVTIRGWIRHGKSIPAHKIGRQWKFKVSELDAWVNSGRSSMDEE
jgi:excisionase family DNA binding protein